MSEPDDRQANLETIADAIDAVADSATKLLAGRLNEDALCLLIRNACPVKSRPTKKAILMVLKAASTLDLSYLKLDEADPKPAA